MLKSAMHLASPVGSGVIETLQKMGVQPETLSGLAATSLSWTQIWNVALSFFQTYGVQVFQVILDIVNTLQSGGFSMDTIQAISNRDGGSLKAILAAILTAFGRPVPSILS